MSYKGQFFEGVFHGMGVLERGTVKFEGEFKDGVKHG